MYWEIFRLCRGGSRSLPNVGSCFCPGVLRAMRKTGNYIGKSPALPGDSKSLTVPYFETLRNADKSAATDLFGEGRRAKADEALPARSAGPCGDRKRLIGFCPRRSAFTTGATPPTALSGSNLSSLWLCRRYLTQNIECRMSNRRSRNRTSKFIVLYSTF
jgi:hypothetical protein